MKVLSGCPVCGSADCTRVYEGRTARLPGDASRWEVQSCRSCGHGFVNPQPNWEELQPYYNSGYDPYSEEHGIDGYAAALAEARATGKLRHVVITKGLRVLDVGCGGGVFLRLARDLGAQVQGVEPSPHGAAITAKAGIPVFNGTLDQFAAQHPHERFDLITSNHVVEHHPQPVELLKTMKSLLAPTGHIWFAVPNAACDSATRLTWRWHSTDLPYHLQQFSPASVRTAADKADLKIADSRTESLPAAVRSSMMDELRFTWKVPRRLSQRLPLMAAAARRARRMDDEHAGEAILVVLR